MLGTLSERCRGQTLHICDISALTLMHMKWNIGYGKKSKHNVLTTPPWTDPTRWRHFMAMNIINLLSLLLSLNHYEYHLTLKRHVKYIIRNEKATPTSLKALPNCLYTPFCLHTTIWHHLNANIKKKIKCFLTLRGLSLFFKIPPISNTLHQRLCCIYFGHRSLSWTQTWLLLWHGVLLVPTCLPWLESLQVLCRIKSNAVLFLFWLELGQRKWSHWMLAPATPQISSFAARETTQLPTRLRGRSH